MKPISLQIQQITMKWLEVLYCVVVVTLSVHINLSVKLPNILLALTRHLETAFLRANELVHLKPTRFEIN